jgi:tetratricopeptide (TPR) repeat protein
VRILSAGRGVDPEQLYSVTGGNPFYVHAVLEAGLGEVQGSARDVVLARAARLGPKAWETLEAAALIGGTVDERLLRHVIAGPALAEVISSGLVAGHPVLRFRHEVARQAIEQAVLPARRAELHARILQGLRTLGCDDDARLAFHAEEAGDGPAALEHAVLAGRRARTLASHREAAGQFERALRFADGEAPASIAARWIELATELSMIDRWPDAETAYTRALENWRAAGDPLGEGDTLQRLSAALWRLCRGDDEILAAAGAAVAILEPLGPTAELAAAYASLAAHQVEPGRLDIAVSLARRAQELAVRFGVPAVQSRAATTEAQAVWLAGGDWEPVLRRALSIALENGIENEAGFAYTNLQELHCGNRDYAKADPYFHDGVAYCDDHDLGTYDNCLRGVRTSSLERLGRWDESVGIAEAVWPPSPRR